MSHYLCVTITNDITFASPILRQTAQHHRWDNKTNINVTVIRKTTNSVRVIWTHIVATHVDETVHIQIRAHGPSFPSAKKYDCGLYGCSVVCRLICVSCLIAHTRMCIALPADFMSLMFICHTEILQHVMTYSILYNFRGVLRISYRSDTIFQFDCKMRTVTCWMNTVSGYCGSRWVKTERMLRVWAKFIVINCKSSNPGISSPAGCFPTIPERELYRNVQAMLPRETDIRQSTDCFNKGTIHSDCVSRNHSSRWIFRWRCFCHFSVSSVFRC